MVVARKRGVSQVTTSFYWVHYVRDVVAIWQHDRDIEQFIHDVKATLQSPL